MHGQISEGQFFIQPPLAQERDYMGIGLAHDGVIDIVQVHQPLDWQITDDRAIHKLQARHIR